MVTFDELANVINNEITEYTESIKKELEQKLDETANKILEYIIENAPRSGRKKAMADHFIKMDMGSGINKTVIIYAKEKGRLIHLIEFGFRHRNGKYVSARPFMRPALDTFTPKMLEDIRNIIRGK